MNLRRITRQEAKNWFGKYHYTGSAAGTMFFMSIAENGEPLCAVAVGRGGNRFGVGEKFGISQFRGDLEITRVASHPSAPFNTTSATISMVCKALADDGIEWLFSYADTAEGHHGGVYQAVNAVFVGTNAKQWVNFELTGKRVSKRMVSGRYGHTRWPDVMMIAESRGDTLRRVEWMPKLTYILVTAKSRARRAHILSALDKFKQPYPKRDSAHTLATPYRNSRHSKTKFAQAGEAGGASTTTASEEK